MSDPFEAANALQAAFVKATRTVSEVTAGLSVFEPRAPCSPW